VICVQYVFESEQQSLWQSAKSRLFNRFVGLLADESIDTKLRALGAAKQFAKKFSSDELAISQLVGSLVDRLKDRSVSVKLAVERALVHCLLIKKDSGRLDKIAAQLDDERAKQLIDVARRVISKLPPDSDDENYQQEDE
jgi:hypothetical protein